MMKRLALLGAVSFTLLAATADAQTIRLTVPEGCASEDAVRARLEELGVRGADDAVVSLTAGESWAGLVRGELRVEQHGRALERTIEDQACRDVIAALTIAAALALREGLPEGEPAPPRGPDELPLDPGEITSPRPLPRPVHVVVVRAAVGLEARVGLGPVPGPSIAPGLAGALEVDSFRVALHAVYWPETTAAGSGALRPDAQVQAITGTLELGARTDGAFGLGVAGVLELGASLARRSDRGVGDASATALADAGLAITMDGRFGPVWPFLRVDLLVALLRPAYLVGDSLAFEAPAVRASLTVGVLFSPEP